MLTAYSTILDYWVLLFLLFLTALKVSSEMWTISNSHQTVRNVVLLFSHFQQHKDYFRRSLGCQKCGITTLLISDGSKSAVGNGDNIEGLFDYFQWSVDCRKCDITFLLISEGINMAVGKGTITDGNQRHRKQFITNSHFFCCSVSWYFPCPGFMVVYFLAFL